MKMNGAAGLPGAAETAMLRPSEQLKTRHGVPPYVFTTGPVLQSSGAVAPPWPLAAAGIMHAAASRTIERFIPPTPAIGPAVKYQFRDDRSSALRDSATA